MGSPPIKTIIWTRGTDDWQSDADLLARLVPQEIRVEHIPCIKLAALETPPALTQETWDHVVFTSAHGVSFALANPDLKEAIKKSKHVYTFGGATAQALAKHGISTIRPEGLRTGEDLGAWLSVHLPKDARVLVPGPKRPAFDLAQFLNLHDFQAQAAICYETEEKAHLPSGADLSSRKLDELGCLAQAVICFASPSAVRGFLAGAPGILYPAAVIGPTTDAEAKKTFPVRRTATDNTFESLVLAALSL